MKKIFTLIIIYLAFISLGLPDTIIGATIPSFQKELGFSLSSGGFISMVIILGTVFSSFFSERVIRKVGTGRVVFASTLLTGLSLLGFSISSSYVFLLLLSLPLGLGGGAIDVSLNHYVALNYKAHHMNWLHSFWGLGATLGPLILSWNLVNNSWRGGYSTISLIQISLSIILLLTLFIWPKSKEDKKDEGDNRSNSVFKLKGIKYALSTMLIYCGIEIGTGLWGSSFLVSIKGFDPEVAAQAVAFYYLGITIGRFITGFISIKLKNKTVVRYSILLALIGGVILFLFSNQSVIFFGFILIGYGLAPIFPGMIHETPKRFGEKISQKVIGYQMGFAYIGSALIPPLLGIVYQFISISLLPLVVISLLLFLALITERLNCIHNY